MVKVSILVPIYNTERFLSQCLDSLVDQTLQEIEIICIDDGSTDDSAKIIRQYAKNDQRIKVISKANSGYGDSMNRGIEKAKGKYIGIVESDDFIDMEAFEKLYEIAEKNNCDVVKSNFYEYVGDEDKDNGKSDLFSKQDMDRIIDPRQDRNIFYQPPCIWAAIYKKSFLRKNKIDFMTTAGASYQDTGFNFKVWAMAKRAYFLERAFLHYRIDNMNSSVKDNKKIYYVKEEYDAVDKYLKKNKILDELGTTLFICRCGGYAWNLHRLGFRSAMQFAKVARKDYIKAKEEGFIQKEQLNKVGKYKKWIIVARFPRIYYILLRPIQNLRNTFHKYRIVG